MCWDVGEVTERLENELCSSGSFKRKFDFGKRKKSNCDVESLECCLSPNNDPQIAHCALAHCSEEGSMRHYSISLVSFVAHLHGGSSKHFYNINIENLYIR